MSIAANFCRHIRGLACLLLLAAGLPAALQAAAAAATQEAIELATDSGTLYGSLVLPARSALVGDDQQVPVVLIVAGSGPTDRDGNSAMGAGSNDSLKLLAQGLADQGIASVRYDKRGVAASRAAGPEEADLRFGHYAHDAAAWVSRLSGDPRFARVGLIGHSEGALVAMLAARQAPAAFLVSVASPAVGAAELLRGQLQGKLPAELAAESDRILASLLAGRTVADVPPALAVLYRPSVQPYLISWFAHRPDEALALLRMPRLIVQGDTDVQVPVAQARQLHAACKACQLHIISGMNHVLKTVPLDANAQRAAYSDPSLPISAALVATLADFIKRN